MRYSIENYYELHQKVRKLIARAYQMAHRGQPWQLLADYIESRLAKGKLTSYDLDLKAQKDNIKLVYDRAIKEKEHQARYTRKNKDLQAVAKPVNHHIRYYKKFPSGSSWEHYYTQMAEYLQQIDALTNWLNRVNINFFGRIRYPESRYPLLRQAISEKR